MTRIPPKGLIIRRRAGADRPGCHNVYYRAVREGTTAFYNQAQREAWAPQATFDPDAPDRLLDQDAWVAELDEQIIGFMTLDKTGYLDMAFVLPEFMGKAVSDALLAALLSHAKEAGYPKLTVHASHLARRFFERNGWRVLEREMHPAAGQIYERFLMEVNLTPPQA